jgi:hypothetical protein
VRPTRRLRHRCVLLRRGAGYDMSSGWTRSARR